MNVRTLWFDRIRNRLRVDSVGTAPMLFENAMAADSDIAHELNKAQPLIVSGEVSRRIAPSGEASEDLKRDFHMPFDPSFIEFEPAVKLPGIRGVSVQGILLRKMNLNDPQPVMNIVQEIVGTDAEVYVARVWMQRAGKTQTLPAMNFCFVPSPGWTGEVIGGGEDLHVVENSYEHRQVMNFLVWLSGYINSPHVLAIRHNRRNDLVRSYRSRGLLAPSSYYTFEPERNSGHGRRQVSSKARTVEVRGHFRRPHWHRLPGGGSAWYGTTWVRPYKRVAPAPEIKPMDQAA